MLAEPQTQLTARSGYTFNVRPAEDADALALLPAPDAPDEDAEALYQYHVKGVYAELLSFMGQWDAPLDEAHQRFWTQSQVVALHLVNAVKDAKHLQKNLRRSLRESDSPPREAYLVLWRHLFTQLHGLYALVDAPPDEVHTRLLTLGEAAVQFQASFTFLNSKFKGLVSALRGD